MSVTVSESLTGGVPVLVGGAPGAMVEEYGDLQYGAVQLCGPGTPSNLRSIVGWRDTPEAQLGDAQRPQAHGVYAGDVYGDAAVVTVTYLLRGTVVDKQNAVDTIEAHTPMDGVDRPLVFNDGSGPWMRLARVINRFVPQETHYRHAPLECSIQFLCADPRRYARDARSAVVSLPASEGGLVYPLEYAGLDYGTSTAGGATVENRGSVATPPVVTFHGPLTDPVLSTPGWRLGFNLPLADGETLTVDTATGAALLNGTADRLYTIRADSDPLEACTLAPGETSLTLASAAGTGYVSLSFRDARM